AGRGRNRRPFPAGMAARSRKRIPPRLSGRCAVGRPRSARCDGCDAHADMMGWLERALPRPLLRAALLVAAVVVPLSAHAVDPYPSRAVRIVVSFPPGTTTDTLARTVALRLGEALAEPVIVENRPGGAGNIGLAIAAKAAPDGYTLTIGGAA